MVASSLGRATTVTFRILTSIRAYPVVRMGLRRDGLWGVTRPKSLKPHSRATQLRARSPLPMLAVPLVALLSACGGEGTTETPAEVARIELSAPKQALTVGESVQLSAIPYSPGGVAIAHPSHSSRDSPS